MLLKALQIARDVHGKEPILYANDLSMTCAKMCLLNFLVNSVDGEVTCGDALKLDWENFTFFKIDKVRNIATGAVLSTYWQYTLSDVEKVQEKRNKWFWWIAEHGWIKYFKMPQAPDAVADGEVVEGDKFEFQVTKQVAEIIKEEQTIDPLPTEIKMGEQLSLFD